MIKLVESGFNTGNHLDTHVYDVFEDVENGKLLGRVARTGGQWVSARYGRGFGHSMAVLYRIISMAPGAKFDDGARFDTLDEVCEAVVDSWTVDGLHTVGEDGLTGFERSILDFETNFRFNHPGNRIMAIRELLGIDESRYSQLLIALVGREEALKYSPVTVNRLRGRLEAAAARRARQGIRAFTGS